MIAGNSDLHRDEMNCIVPPDTLVSVLSDQPFFLPDASGWLTVPAWCGQCRVFHPHDCSADRRAHLASALATAAVTAPLTINLTNRGRTWDLNNVVFDDGSRAIGYFTIKTGQYLRVNIQVRRPDPDPDLGIYRPTPEPLLLPAERVDATFVNDRSGASEMALQNPVTNTPVSWTYLQFNFLHTRLRMWWAISSVVDPTFVYTPYCTEDYWPT